MFLKLRPELEKQKQPKKNIYLYIYIYMYIHAQVIQTCTTLSRVEIYDMDWKRQDVEQRKRKPGMRFVVMFFSKNKCRRSQPSPVSPNPRCWKIHLASAWNCSTVTSSKFLFLTTSTSWQKIFSSSLHIDWKNPHWHLVIKKSVK